MPPKNKSSTKFKGTKNKPKGGFFNFQRSIKKYSFSELEGLIQQARQTKKKPLVQKYKILYRQKLNAWAKSWELGRQKLLANQKVKRAKKEAQIRAQQAKEQSRFQKKRRLGEIYDYFRQELNKLDKSKHPEYFTAYLDLEPHLATHIKKLQRKHPDYDPWKEFGHKHTAYRLNQGGQQYLIKKTNQAYREEIADQESQLRYYKDKIGSLNPNTKEFLKSEQFKYFFPEKGEHKELFRRRKEFVAEREKILTEFKGQRVKSLTQLLDIYKRLYQKSPWRIRDRFLIPTSQPAKEVGMGEIWNKYWKNNTDYPFSYSRRHYLRAIREMLIKPRPIGELVPDSEIEVDKYGNPRLKEGQVLVLIRSKPGRSWSIYKNVPSLEKWFEKEIHFKAHESYMNEYGTELEKDIFFNRRKKGFLCVIEAMGFDCRAGQGTSEPWCFFCVQWGNPYHPPVLPIHCPWRYTFKTSMCGAVEHREANKQWHWSLQGEKTNVAGKDWGSCHVGRYDHKKRSKR